jgi:hypothetical protein
MCSEFGQPARETEGVAVQHDLAPADDCDPVIDANKKDLDRTLLRENLKLTVEVRFIKFERFWEYSQELRGAGRKARQTGSGHGAEPPPDPAASRSE